MADQITHQGTSTFDGLTTAAKTVIQALNVVNANAVHITGNSPESPPEAGASNVYILIALGDDWTREDAIAEAEEDSGVGPQMVFSGELHFTYWYRSSSDQPGMADHIKTSPTGASNFISQFVDKMDDEYVNGNLIVGGVTALPAVSPLMEPLSIRKINAIRIQDSAWTAFVTTWFCRFSLTQT